jgi:hypothetical protein
VKYHRSRRKTKLSSFVFSVVLCYCWLVVLAYYQEMCLRITLPMSPLKAVVTDLPPTMTTIVGLQD